MPQTYQSVSPLIATAKDIATDTKNLLARVHEFLETNSDASIDWGNNTPPAVLQLDGDGNLAGFLFGPADLANLIGSLDQFRNLVTGQAVSEGDHLANLNRVASVETVQ